MVQASTNPHGDEIPKAKHVLIIWTMPRNISGRWDSVIYVANLWGSFQACFQPIPTTNSSDSPQSGIQHGTLSIPPKYFGCVHPPLESFTVQVQCSPSCAQRPPFQGTVMDMVNIPYHYTTYTYQYTTVYINTLAGVLIYDGWGSPIWSSHFIFTPCTHAVPIVIRPLLFYIT